MSSYDDDQIPTVPDVESSFRAGAGTEGAYVEGGFLHSDDGKGISADSLDFGAQVGSWRDPSGGAHHGIHGDASTFKFNVDPSVTGGLGADGTGPGLEAGATYDDQTASIGASANLGAIGVTAGDAENSVRFGVSAGPGFALRSHYGDADHDGIDELGFGLDAGPFSFDVRSAALGRMFNTESPFEQQGYLPTKRGGDDPTLRQRYFDRAKQRLDQEENGSIVEKLDAMVHEQNDVATPPEVIQEARATRALEAETSRQVARSRQIQDLVKVKNSDDPMEQGMVKQLAEQQLHAMYAD